MSSLVLAGQFRSLPSSERFWFLDSVQNKFRLTRMRSLGLAGQFRSLPSSERFCFLVSVQNKFRLTRKKRKKKKNWLTPPSPKYTIIAALFLVFFNCSIEFVSFLFGRSCAGNIRFSSQFHTLSTL